MSTGKDFYAEDNRTKLDPIAVLTIHEIIKFDKSLDQNHHLILPFVETNVITQIRTNFGVLKVRDYAVKSFMTSF